MSVVSDLLVSDCVNTPDVQSLANSKLSDMNDDPLVSISDCSSPALYIKLVCRPMPMGPATTNMLGPGTIDTELVTTVMDVAATVTELVNDTTP